MDKSAESSDELKEKVRMVDESETQQRKDLKTYTF